MGKLIRLNSADNVFVVCSSIFPGHIETINGHTITFDKTIGLGHKIAACTIMKGLYIIKFGVPIGSTTTDITVGEHVHLHNLKSDYISTYTLTHEFIDTK